MKKLAFCALIGAATLTASADLQMDFSSAKDLQIKNHLVTQNGHWRAKLWNWNPKDKNHKPMSAAVVELQDGSLKIDTTKCPVDKNGEYGMFVLEIFSDDKAKDANAAYAGKNMKTSIEVKAEPSTLAELTPSYSIKNGTHYQRGGNVAFLPQWQKVEKNFTVRADITGEPTWRMTFTKPGIIWIRNASITFPAPEQKAVIKGNQILNGGAERGWYAVSGSDFSNLIGGHYRDWLGKIWTQAMIVQIDDKEAASGKYSFRLGDGGPQFQNWFRFNPVKFQMGERTVVTFKAKSKSGHSRLLFFAAVSTSDGYRKFFDIGPEWKEYRFEIPKFGQSVGNISGNYANKGDNQFYPTFWVDKTAWLDDLCIWQGSGEVKFENPSPVAISGEIDSRYKKTGEKIVAKLNIRNTTGAPLKADVAYRLLDFYGKELEKEILPSVSLAKDGNTDIAYNHTVKHLGPQTLLFQVTANGKTIDHGFLFGGIGHETSLVKRLAIDTHAASTAEFILPFFLDMRIGTARLWSQMSGANFTDVPTLKDLHNAGVQTFLNVSIDDKDGRYSSFSRYDLSSWRDAIRKYVMPYKDYIDVYEILNEPNIWNGYRKNPDPSIYCEMSPAEYIRVLKTARQYIMEFAPNAKFAGPTPCGTDIGFISNVLKAGGDKYLDIITEHPYRSAAEMPDYYTDLQNLEKVLAQYGSKPHWATESGIRSEEMMNDNKVTPYIRTNTAKNLRMMLTAYAGGAGVYTHFNFWTWGGSASWQVTATGATGRPYEYVPQPVLYGMRAIADMIGDEARPAGAVSLGFEYKCYIFDNGKERTVTFWKWNGAPVSITPGPEFRGTFYDVMGNPVKGELEISDVPLYFKTALSVDEVKKLCPALVPDNGKAACNYDVFVTGPNSVEAVVTNRGIKPLKGEIVLSFNGKTLKAAVPEILAGKSVRIPFRVPVTFSTEPTAGKLALNLNGQTFEQTLALKSLFVPEIRNVTIDGSLDEWKDIPAIRLSSPGNRIRFFNETTQKAAEWTARDNAVTADIKTAWNEKGFYIAVTVNKAEFHPNEISAARVWEGDSLQIAFDPLKNATKDSVKYDGDDFEYSIGLFKGAPVVYRHYASLSIYDSLTKTVGELKGEVVAAIKPLPGKTVYEIQFVPRSLSPFKLKEGSSMRFNLIVNMNNGKERIGWLQFTPGIGEIKKPGLFMDLLLMK